MYDYSAIRPRGQPIKGFGGVASGPDVLRSLHGDIDGILAPLAGGKPLTITAIVDVMNVIGRCIVSGDVRQTAEIAFGDAGSQEYIDLKDYAKNPRRAAWGWTSNNSVYAGLGQSYDEIVKRVVVNGEPGFAWLDNMRRYGRMADPPNDLDSRVKGGNPCLEQSLESYELCCLVEAFPNNHADVEDFKATLKSAFLYAKTVTLGGTHWAATNRVMLRNRRIGASLSGLAQFVASRGLSELHRWCHEGYALLAQRDIALSEWLAIPRSIKRTSIKPSGTVSLLAGATPGIHAPEARFYLRRVRLGKDHDLVGHLRGAGYVVEPAAEDPSRKVVVTFPVDAGAGVRTLDSLSMWEQLEMAAFCQVRTRGRLRNDCTACVAGQVVLCISSISWPLPPDPLPRCSLPPPSPQAHWADNQVSATITFDPQTEGPQLARALDMYQYRLKGVSFLPRAPTAVYAQLPYEAISEEAYRAASDKLRPLDIQRLHAHATANAAGKGLDPVAPKFCTTDACETSVEDGRRVGGCESPAA